MTLLVGSSSLEVQDAPVSGADAGLEEAIFTCKFPGCTRQYASTDGVRKHCRKSHPEWLREVDLDKGNLGCRWAAYCTRETITETHDPRTTPVGSKRARELLGQAGELPSLHGAGLASALKATGGVKAAALSFAESSSSSRAASFARDDEPPPPQPKAPQLPVAQLPAHAVAMDGKSALVPLGAAPAAAEQAQASSSASSENMMPPEMIALPGELNSPLPANVSALTPNAQARARLGEIADSESVCLQGGTAHVSHLPSSPGIIDARDVAAHALQAARGSNSFFDQWGMPPLKRGMSLADTRELAAQQAMLAASSLQVESEEAPSQDSPAIESFLA